MITRAVHVATIVTLAVQYLGQLALGCVCLDGYVHHVLLHTTCVLNCLSAIFCIQNLKFLSGFFGNQWTAFWQSMVTILLSIGLLYSMLVLAAASAV